MGMFSEANASGNAAMLKDILTHARNTGNAAVIAFARRFVYPHYLGELGEAFEPLDQEFNKFWNLDE